MVRLEETIREIKGHNKKTTIIAENGSKSEANKPYHVILEFVFIKYRS